MAAESVKCVVVGDGAVGKTSMLLSFIRDEFPEEHVPTVFDNEVKEVRVDDKIVQLNLWDTAGQEDYKRLRPLSYPGAHVFLVCFNTTGRDSFENITEVWIPEVKHHAPGVPFLLVGTKIDLRTSDACLARLRAVGQEPVSTKEGQELAESLGAVGYAECSALTQFGLEDVFGRAIRCGLNAKHVRPSPSKKFRCAIL